MKIGRRAVGYGICLLLGVGLVVLGVLEIVDAFWSGMGAALVVISVLRLMQMYRFRKNESYRERMETEVSDERNRFLRNNAWAWAGYLFVLIAAIAAIVLRVMGQDLLSLAASYAVALIVLLYWIAYLLLRNKY